MAISATPPKITVNQIVAKDGTPAAATLTSNLWVGSPNVFSRPTEGNKIEAFTTGKAYFANLIAAFDTATSEICIAGWQVSWDALLAPGVRLYDVLLRAAKRGVRIYVMPWNDTEPIQTYDDETKAVLISINDQPGVHGEPVRVGLSKSVAAVNPTYFSHHQKQVVVDRKIAYVGGIDLSYGRYDDATYDLHADKDGRQVLNSYNGCVAWVGTLSETDPNVVIVNADDLTGALDSASVPYLMKSNASKVAGTAARGAWQVPYAKNTLMDTMVGNPRFSSNTPDLHTLDPKRQPRMPWQDVHSRIEGPAVSDLLRSFVNRWNTLGDERLDPAPATTTYAKPGKAFIQVLRSAPAALCAAEYKALADKKETKAPSGTQDDIHAAMVQLIQKASHFIYIETQFFVSGFGHLGGATGTLSPAAQFVKDGPNGISDSALDGVRWYHTSTTKGDVDEPPRNKVCAALVERIRKAIEDRKRPNFHVYITLPVHPEGLLNDATVVAQVYWTMQTLVFGSRSLLNGIRRALKARELRDAKDPAFNRVYDEGNTEYESVDVEKCFAYVTLLNLRTWAKLGSGKDERYVTEQIYVHTKMMIVDDLYALVGSANTNDRSLLGERDSEIAVLVMDGEASRADIKGTGNQRPVRKFARALRMSVWEKLFGITGGVRPATHLRSAIAAPASPNSWRSIQQQAKKNAQAYEAAFKFVPRNSDPNDKSGSTAASVLPIWDRSPSVQQRATKATPEAKTGLMPFEPAFWSSPQHVVSAVGRLGQTQGFLSALPIRWTEGENNRIAFPTAVIVQNGEPSTQTPFDAENKPAFALVDEPPDDADQPSKTTRT